MLLAVVGAFVLACMAMQSRDTLGLWVLIAYSAFIVGPLTALEIRKGKQ
jgi:hypothetical protein